MLLRNIFVRGEYQSFRFGVIIQTRSRWYIQHHYNTAKSEKIARENAYFSVKEKNCDGPSHYHRFWSCKIDNVVQSVIARLRRFLPHFWHAVHFPTFLINTLRFEKAYKVWYKTKKKSWFIIYKLNALPATFVVCRDWRTRNPINFTDPRRQSPVNSKVFPAEFLLSDHKTTETDASTTVIKGASGRTETLSTSYPLISFNQKLPHRVDTLVFRFTLEWRDGLLF